MSNPHAEKLRSMTMEQQFANDIEFWRRTLTKPGRPGLKNLLERIFITLKYGGLIYRENMAKDCYQSERNGEGGWRWWNTARTHENGKHFPLAAALSHGGRVMIQLGRGNTDYWTWLTHGLLTSGISHGAGHMFARIATHGITPSRSATPLHVPRMKFITEQKGFGTAMKNIGHHFGVNIPLGGDGQMNPFSKKIIHADGCHGHIYLYWLPPKANWGGVLIGVEGSEALKVDQYGHRHSPAGDSSEFSPTGGQKWRYLCEGPGCQHPDGSYWTEGARTKTKKGGFLWLKKKQKDVPPPAHDTMMVDLQLGWDFLKNKTITPNDVAGNAELPEDIDNLFPPIKIGVPIG